MQEFVKFYHKIEFGGIKKAVVVLQLYFQVEDIPDKTNIIVSGPFLKDIFIMLLKNCSCFMKT
jgi:hypothetical protein